MAVKRAAPLLLLILLLATGLRFYRLDAQSFWNDEGNSARLSERAVPLIIEGTASDIHPPLYYLALRGWRELLGEHEFGLRAFSAFAGVLTVAATFALARLLLPAPRTGPVPWLAALLAAVNPALIYYSQETRMYALLALLSVLATLALLRWLATARGRGWAAAYVLLITAGLYTHYFFPTILLLHGVILLLASLRHAATLVFAPLELTGKRPLRRTWLGWLGMLGVAGLLYLPWLPVFVRQAGGRSGARAPFLSFVADSLRWQAFGETVAPDQLVWAVAAVGVLLLLARRRSAVPLLGVFIPVLAMFAAGTTAPAFYKFMLTAVPFLTVALALGVGGPWALSVGGPWALGAGEAWRRPSFRAALPAFVAALFLLPILLGTGLSLGNLYTNPAFARADYRAMAARIAADDHPNAAVILNAPNQWEVFTYYHRAGAPVYPLPKGQPDPAVLEPELARIAAAHDRIYALFWGAEQRDPQRVVERWLDANAFKASEEWVGDVRFVVYAVPAAPPTEMETAVDAQFGEAIMLKGAGVQGEALRPGDVLGVTLFWETAAPLETRYKVFLHLLDAQGNLVAQRDSEPGGGSLPTTAWSPGETVVDNHGVLLPADLPPGAYDLVVGLYDAADPAARLPVRRGELTSDTLPLTTITVN